MQRLNDASFHVKYSRTPCNARVNGKRNIAERAHWVHGVMVTKNQNFGFATATPMHMWANRRINQCGGTAQHALHHRRQGLCMGSDPSNVTRRRLHRHQYAEVFQHLIQRELVGSIHACNRGMNQRSKTVCICVSGEESTSGRGCTPIPSPTGT